jgi:hypothetical protein
MAILLGSNQGLSTAAYTKSANLLTGRNQFCPKGRITLIIKGSAIGMNATLNVGGVSLADDQPLPSIGTTGTLSVNDNVLVDQVVAGGTAELYIRNTTAGALTTDYQVNFTPM